MSQQVIVRPTLETADGFIRPLKAIIEAPDKEALIESAAKVIKSEIKEAIWGLAPIFGKDQVLALVMQIINEDFDPDGPQTPMPDELRDAADDDEDEEGEQ